MKSNMTLVTSESDSVETEQTRSSDKHFKHLECLNQRMYLKNNSQTFTNLLASFLNIN